MCMRGSAVIIVNINDVTEISRLPVGEILFIALEENGLYIENSARIAMSTRNPADV